MTGTVEVPWSRKRRAQRFPPARCARREVAPDDLVRKAVHPDDEHCFGCSQNKG